MNLISCYYCGTVLDKNRIAEPKIYDIDTQEFIEGTCTWSSEFRDFMPVIDCPVCGHRIFYNDGGI